MLQEATIQEESIGLSKATLAEEAAYGSYTAVSAAVCLGAAAAMALLCRKKQESKTGAADDQFMRA